MFVRMALLSLVSVFDMRQSSQGGTGIMGSVLWRREGPGQTLAWPERESLSLVFNDAM